LLRGFESAPTAEALMRSRFTAHVVRDDAYLNRTYRPPGRIPSEPTPPSDRFSWTRLIVHRHELGPAPQLAVVEFSAFFVDENGEHVLHERSEFVQHEGKWFYTRALAAASGGVSRPDAAGRNDPCPCGSGRKFKHCCLKSR
jgi:SEC-C motif domain protein